MKWLPLVIALAVGALCGYFLNEASHGRTESSRSDASERSDVKSKPTTANNDSSSSDSPLTQTEPASIEVENFIRSLGEKTSFEEYGELHGLLENATNTDFAALMENFSWDGYAANWSVIDLIAIRWAQVDPEGMFTYANKKDARYNWGIKNALFRAWAETDPLSAIGAAREIASPNARLNALKNILSVVAQDDPERALDALESEIGFSGGDTWVYQNIFSQWSSHDPERAREVALSLPDGPAKVSALSGALSEWISRDAVGALDWLDSLPSEGTSYYARKQVFRDIVQQDFDAAREYVGRKDDPLEKRKILENIYVGNLAHDKSLKEIVEILDWMKTVTTGQLYDQKVQQAVQAIAERDPRRAMAFALQMPTGNGRRNALASIGSALAQRDPAAALAFANSLEFEDEKLRVLGSLGLQMARGDVAGAGRMILEANDSVIEQQLSGSLAEEWSIYDRSAALTWIESLSDEVAKTNALQRVVKNWMQSDPAAALNYLETEVVDEVKRQNYLRSAFSDWGRQDPARAVEWLQDLPESAQSIKGNLYRNVAQSYLQHDPYAASQWIETLKEGDARDYSIQALVDSISENDPESAFIWAGTMSRESNRVRALEGSVRKWARNDPESAYRAIRDSKIAAIEKEPLFNVVKQQQRFRK